MTARAAALAYVFVLIATTAAAQNADIRLALLDLASYHRFVDDYRSTHGDPVGGIAALDHSRVLALLRQINSPADPNRPWDAVSLEAAAMLHTDAAMRLVASGRSDDAFFHFFRAADLLERPPARGSRFERDWYVAVARWLRDRNWIVAAQRYLELGRRRLPGNAAILYESAWLAEVMAGYPSLRAESEKATTWHGALLNDAVRWYREALERDGANTAARLHLGRVQTLRGR